jgi:hypothetical protein
LGWTCWSAGGIAGINDGTIHNSYAAGTVTGDENVGGITGFNGFYIINNINVGGKIVNSYFLGTVIGTDEQVGGIAGRNTGSIIGCYFEGDVSGGNFVGGITGYNVFTRRGVNDYLFGETIGCWSTGTVSGHMRVGGIAGRNDGIINDCYSESDVTGTFYGAAGIAGVNNTFNADGNVLRAEIRRSYATGAINGVEDVGGIIGECIGTTLNSAALNSSINAGFNASRVAGHTATLLLVNNHARNGLIPRVNGANVPVTPGLTTRDGANVSAGTGAGQYNNQTFWSVTLGFDFTNVWEWDTAANLPKLRFSMADLGENPNKITILEQPAASMTVTEGIIYQTLTISVTTELRSWVTRQWYISTTPSNTGGTAIPGAIHAEFAIPYELGLGTHYFYCVLETVLAVPVVSNIAAVTVIAPSGLTVANGRSVSAVGDTISWSFNDYGHLQLSGTGALRNFSWADRPWNIFRGVVKTAVLSNGITAIGNSNFDGFNRMTSITIPASVTTIGRWGLSGCASLTEINLPGVTLLDEYALSGCRGLTVLNLPNVTEIRYGALRYCTELTSINMPRVVTIGGYVFEYSDKLTELHLPASLTTVGTVSFVNMNGLQNFSVDPANPNFSVIGGVLTNKSGTTILNYPRGRSGAYTVPVGVTAIGDGAFIWHTGLTAINMINVTSIGPSAFSGTLIAELNIPNVTSIGNSAFSQCHNLTEINLPNVQTLSAYAFYSCKGIKTAVMPNVLSIGIYAFAYCDNLISVDMPRVTVLEREAFYYCIGLTSVNMPSVVNIGAWAFAGCKNLKSVTIPAAVNEIGRNAFHSCIEMTAAYFLGNPPAVFGADVFDDTADGFTIYYPAGNAAWLAAISGGRWHGYNALPFTP